MVIYLDDNLPDTRRPWMNGSFKYLLAYLQ